MMDEKAKESKTELLFKFEEESTILIVAVKLPGESPRVMQTEIEMDPITFLSDFSATWRELGDKVRAEFTRVALGREP